MTATDTDASVRGERCYVPGTADPVVAREAMVARLETAGRLGPGTVREALLAIRREVLIPQAYVRRSAPGEEPPRWDLLDWGALPDRVELLGLLYGGGSVLVQHDGEPLLGRARGARSGGVISSMSSVTGMTAELLQELDLRPGQRVLDVGTGAGFTAAVACHVCGDEGVVSLDRDRHLVESAAGRLADLGFHPHLVCGAGGGLSGPRTVRPDLPVVRGTTGSLRPGRATGTGGTPVDACDDRFTVVAGARRRRAHGRRHPEQ